MAATSKDFAAAIPASSNCRASLSVFPLGGGIGHGVAQIAPSRGLRWALRHFLHRSSLKIKRQSKRIALRCFRFLATYRLSSLGPFIVGRLSTLAFAVTVGAKTQIRHHNHMSEINRFLANVKP